MKCKSKVQANGTTGKDKKGKPRMEGKCSKCSSKVFRYISSK
jgi:hypothetical protein